MSEDCNNAYNKQLDDPLQKNTDSYKSCRHSDSVKDFTTVFSSLIIQLDSASKTAMKIVLPTSQQQHPVIRLLIDRPFLLNNFFSLNLFGFSDEIELGIETSSAENSDHFLLKFYFQFIPVPQIVL